MFIHDVIHRCDRVMQMISLHYVLNNNNPSHTFYNAALCMRHTVGRTTSHEQGSITEKYPAGNVMDCSNDLDLMC